MSRGKKHFKDQMTETVLIWIELKNCLKISINWTTESFGKLQGIHEMIVQVANWKNISNFLHKSREI